MLAPISHCSARSYVWVAVAGAMFVINTVVLVANELDLDLFGNFHLSPPFHLTFTLASLTSPYLTSFRVLAI